VRARAAGCAFSRVTISVGDGISLEAGAVDARAVRREERRPERFNWGVVLLLLVLPCLSPPG
jgi:hypothetical protein